MRRWTVFFCILLLCCPAVAPATEEDDLFADVLFTPRVVLHSPLPGIGVDNQNGLYIYAEGRDVTRMELEVSWQNGLVSHAVDGAQLEIQLELPPVATPITVLVRGFGAPDAAGVEQSAVVERVLPTPREQLIQSMLALALSNSKDKRYNFARAHEGADPGICKNFVMRMFDTFKDDYRMLTYPELKLHMPQNNLKANCAPYQYGVEWAMEGAEEGNPFEVVAAYRYDESLNEEENRQLARAMLEQAQQGDFYQMAGNYVDGNGPHSLIFIEDFDPAQDLLRWTDSNMKGTRVDGIRWGYLLWDTQHTVEWMCDAICHPTWGATLYRLRDDLVYWQQAE